MVDPFSFNTPAGREDHNFSITCNLNQIIDCRVLDNPKHTTYLLDLFLTSDPSTFTFTISAPLNKSGHSLIKINFSFDLSKPKTQHFNRKIWLFHRADFDEMRSFFGQFPWNFFFNEIECKKGRTRMMQPLWISKDPCITEEKGKLIKWQGGGAGFCEPGFSRFEDCKCLEIRRQGGSSNSLKS